MPPRFLTAGTARYVTATGNDACPLRPANLQSGIAFGPYGPAL